MFTQPSYNTSYPETFIANGFLPPPDGFLNTSCVQGTGDIEYMIANGSDSEPFSIDSTTGELSSEVLDYETKTSYSFEIICIDDNTSMMATAQVNIDIIPVNEYEPTLIDSSIALTVCPSVPVGTVFVSTLPQDNPLNSGLISASDDDAGPDGVLHFTLSNDSFSSAFEIVEEDRLIQHFKSTGLLSLFATLFLQFRDVPTYR